MAIDPAAGKIYWANFFSDGIRVANLDGSGTVSTLFDGGLAAYAGWRWTRRTTRSTGPISPRQEIRVGNLDGTGVPATLFTETAGSRPSGVAIDPAANKIYWTNQFSDEVRVGNLDGTGLAATLFAGEDNPIGVAIAAGKLYWTDLNSGLVRAGNPNGSGATTLFSGEANAGGVAVDPTTGKIYWVTFFGGTARFESGP